MIAREHLGYVFDASSYDVACTLRLMARAAHVFSKVRDKRHDTPPHTTTHHRTRTTAHVPPHTRYTRHTRESRT
jgi:hypothetical protein